MSTYEIRLVCPFCEAFTVLGTVEAPTPCNAKHQAADLWPDARYEEMVPYIKQEQPVGVASMLTTIHKELDRRAITHLEIPSPLIFVDEMIPLLNDQIMQGLLTPQEATLIASGRTI